MINDQIITRDSLKNEEYQEMLQFYDALYGFYLSKSDVERKNLDLGITLLFNPDFYKKYKKSSINHKSEIIPELFYLIHYIYKLLETNNISEDEFEITKLENINIDESNFVKLNLSESDYKLINNINLFLLEFGYTEFNKLYKLKKINLETHYNLNNFFHSIHINQQQKIGIISNNDIILSFNLKISTHSHIFNEFVNSIIKNGFISKNQKNDFMAACHGISLREINKIIWHDDLYSLRYFLSKLVEKSNFKEKNQFFKNSIHFFLDRKGNEITESQIIKGKTNIPEKVKKIIDDIFLIIGK